MRQEAKHLSKIIEDRPFEYDEEGSTTDAIKALFATYCKNLFADKEIDYFDGFSLEEVLKKSRARSEWDEKLSTYELAKETFPGLKVFENN